MVGAREVRTDLQWRERNTNMLNFCCTARCPESEPILSRDELAEFTRRLSMLSAPRIESTYQTAYADCHYDGKRSHQPPPFNNLVTAWRMVRRFRQLETRLPSNGRPTEMIE
jgi:hypothetical protein